MRERKQNHFFIIGNGGGGTSLLRGLLNAHSKLEVMFESKANGLAKIDESKQWFQNKADEAGTRGKLWANKIPIEQLFGCNWTDDDIASLVDDFKVVWLIRRFNKYWKHKKNSEPKYRQDWERTQKIYWQARERAPERIIQVSFEDLLLRPAIELKRICVFLGVQYEAPMMQGTLNTGYRKYDQATINLEKV